PRALGPSPWAGIGVPFDSHALFDRRRRPPHHRSPGPPGSGPERGQRPRSRRARAAVAPEKAEEGAPVRDRGRLRVPSDRHALGDPSDPHGLGEAGGGHLPPLSSPEALRAPAAPP